MAEIKTYCGGQIGALGATYYSPGHIPLKGKKGKKCITCFHWEKRKTDPSWRNEAECPCFECAGYGYSMSDDLMFWEPIT